MKMRANPLTMRGHLRRCWIFTWRTPANLARVLLNDELPQRLSVGSPFASVGEAADFLKYKPCALAPAGPGAVEIVRINRREMDWKCRVVTAEESAWDFLATHDATPEVCYAIEPIDYEWMRGETRRVA